MNQSRARKRRMLKRARTKAMNNLIAEKRFNKCIYAVVKKCAKRFKMTTTEVMDSMSRFHCEFDKHGNLVEMSCSIKARAKVHNIVIECNVNKQGEKC